MINQDNLNQRVQHLRERSEQYLNNHLPENNLSTINQAMRYATLGGGKRLRASLVYSTGAIFSIPYTVLDAPAAAVEIIHAYSLIHDDLPAMDDDAIRRGKPSCHKKFGEAIAILAGDALQPLAFETIINEPQLTVRHDIKLKMLNTLAHAVGHQGMVLGQFLDLAATNKKTDVEQLKQIHLAKTGALMKASVLLGALCHEAITEKETTALINFITCMGLAFQMHDDILDEEGETTKLGKPQGSDREKQKATYPAILGIEKTKQLTNELLEKSQQYLAIFGQEADLLRHIAVLLVQREH